MATITAVLLNTPGAPEATATTFDGYPLAQKGKGGKALKVALLSSVFGDIFSTILVIAVAAAIASYALKMGPAEINIRPHPRTYFDCGLGERVISERSYLRLHGSSI